MAPAAARRIRAWLFRRGTELRLSLRVTVAGLLAFALAELFHLAQGYWAVLTAIIVVQASVGGSLKAGIDRLLGTLCGAAYGALVALLVPHVDPAARGAALIAAVAPLALLAALRAGFRVAPVTAVIVLLGGGAQPDGALAAAIGRVSEIGLGCIVGLGVSLIVLPARAQRLAITLAARTLALLAELLAALSLGAPESTARGDIRGINDRLRGALRQLDVLGREAERERKSRLTDARDPEPLIRTLRRLRSDLVSIARATATPLAEPCRGRLAAPLAAITAACVRWLRAAGKALAAAEAPPAPAEVERAIDGYAAALAELRQAAMLQGLPGEEAGRIFALGFALEQLRRDLQDLASRAGELAEAPPGPEEPSS